MVDQRKACKIGRRAQPLLDEAQRTHRQHRVVEQPLDMQIGMLAVADADRDVDAVGSEIGELHGGGDARIDVRIRVQETPQPRHEPFGGKADGDADHQDVGIALAVEPRDRAAHALKSCVQARIERPARPGQLDGTRAPGEQQKPELFLRPQIWWLSAAGVTCSSSAARAKLMWRAIASNARSAFSGSSGCDIH